MTFASIILALVTLQRMGELALARSNTKRLLGRGAVETGAGHYPWLVAMHASWLLSLWVWGWHQPVSLPWLGFFLLLQILRCWVLATLGPRWTTRIIVLPKEPLVQSGPYRFLSPPNYAVVTGEIMTLPLALGLPVIAVVFTVLNGLMLAVRIRAESSALSERSYFL
jgi:methyltransferase